MDERNPENRKTTEQHADDILQSDIEELFLSVGRF